MAEGFARHCGGDVRGTQHPGTMPPLSVSGTVIVMAVQG